MRHAVAGPLDSALEVRPCLADRVVNLAAGLVADQDLVNPGVEVEGLPGGAGRHVGEDQRIEDGGVLPLVDGQLCRQTALLCFVNGPGVVSYQPHETRRRTQCFQVTGTVEGMDPGVTQLGGVTDVVQPCSGDEEIPVSLRHSRDSLLSPSGHSLSV